MKAIDLKGVALLRFYSKAKRASLSSVLGSGAAEVFLISLFLFSCLGFF